MLDLHEASGRRDNCDGVDANRGANLWMRLAPGAGEPPQPGEFRDRDCLERMAVRETRPRLDLDEDDLAIFRGDDVDLALPASPIALDDVITRCDQVVCSEVFTPPAQVILRCHIENYDVLPAADAAESLRLWSTSVCHGDARRRWDQLPDRHTVVMRNRWIFLALLIVGIISLAYSILTILVPRAGINPIEPFLFGAALVIAAVLIRRRFR
jgi:hypothetical protein